MKTVVLGSVLAVAIAGAAQAANVTVRHNNQLSTINGVNESTTICQVKALAASRMGFNAFEYDLRFKHKSLPGGGTLGSLGIRNGNSLSTVKVSRSHQC